jgi:hypothetical protein
VVSAVALRGSPKKTVRRRAAAPATGVSTTVASALADLDPAGLLPKKVALDTGLRIAQRRAGGTVFETKGSQDLIKGSNAPDDDQRLLADHPFLGGASSVWTTNAALTDVSVSVLKFRGPADAQAVRDRWREQEQGRIERLAARMQDPNFSKETVAGLGDLDVAEFVDPQARRLTSTQRGPMAVHRYRGTRGQYLFEVTSRRQLDAKGAPLRGAPDPAPSASELLLGLTAQLDASLGPLR